MFNIVILGSPGVGKTNFIRKIQSLKFEPKYIPSSGNEIHIIDNNKMTSNIIVLGKYDNDKFNYSTAKTAMIMFDVTNRLSYRQVKDFIEEIRNKNKMSIIVCANKVDIENYRVISKDEAEEFCKLNRVVYIENTNYVKQIKVLNSYFN